MQTEMKSNPLGINVEHPRFSWQIASGKADLQQTAYRIQVATSAEELKAETNLVWDSNEIDSDQSVLVPYNGPALQPNTRYFWRVKVTTNQSAGGWSDIRMWSMALQNEAWKAKWIGENALSNEGETDQGDTRLAARYLRKPFSIEKEVKHATLYISGLGSSEPYLNGQRVSADVFAPMPSLYSTRVYYNVYDVTSQVQKGDNALGVIVGNGRYLAMRVPGMMTFGLPSLLVQLELEYEDGTTSRVVSDET